MFSSSVPHCRALKGETFYYLLELFRKPQRAQRHAEKNNTSLRPSASSAVNLFCHDPFIRNKLKSHLKVNTIPENQTQISNQNQPVLNPLNSRHRCPPFFHRRAPGQISLNKGAVIGYGPQYRDTHISQSGLHCP